MPRLKDISQLTTAELQAAAAKLLLRAASGRQNHTTDQCALLYAQLGGLDVDDVPMPRGADVLFTTRSTFVEEQK